MSFQWYNKIGRLEEESLRNAKVRRVITQGHYLGPGYNKAVYGLVLASIESYLMPILQRKGRIAIVLTKAALQL